MRGGTERNSAVETNSQNNHDTDIKVQQDTPLVALTFLPQLLLETQCMALK
jgi:CMP-2-keto-3-deoxyoctulosonic acid synthetase